MKLVEHMRRCKFVLCPRGNAIDCHRNMETMVHAACSRNETNFNLEELYKDYQVLFVDDYSEVNEQLLLDNNQMFLDAQSQDLSQLDLNNFFEKWKKTLVVSNYNWDLEWLKMTYDHGLSPDNTVIYDKSDVSKDLSHLGEVIKSPNMDSNQFDILRFIIENYEDLPDMSVFIKGNLFQGEKTITQQKKDFCMKFKRYRIF